MKWGHFSPAYMVNQAQVLRCERGHRAVRQQSTGTLVAPGVSDFSGPRRLMRRGFHMKRFCLVAISLILLANALRQPWCAVELPGASMSGAAGPLVPVKL